jgi:methionine biosynthesis protein MetW
VQPVAEFYDREWREHLAQQQPPAGFRSRHTLERHAAAAELLGPGGRFLDVGCGLGHLTALMLDRGAQCVGVDVSPLALSVAREQFGDRVELHEASIDGGMLPFENASFDKAGILAVLEHVFDPYAVMNELGRVVRPGGRIVAEVPNLAYAKHRLTLLRGRLPATSDSFGPATGWDGGHLHYFAERAFRHLIESAGFRVTHVTGTGLFARYRNWRPGLLCGDLMIAAERSA